MGNGAKRKSKHQAPAAGELVNKSALDASPCPEGTLGSRGRSRWEGEACREQSGLARVWVPRALGLEMRPAPGTRPSRSPGADARSHGARILQTCPGPRGRGRGRSGSHTGTRDRRRRPACHPPPAEGIVSGPRLAPKPPRLPGVSRCSLQPARRAPAPTPEGRYLGAPAPESLLAVVGASLQLPHPTSASAEGEGRGRGERRNRPFLRRSPPAGIAAGGARARRSAAQRGGRGGAGGLASPRTPAPRAPPPPLPSSVLGRRAAGRPLPTGPGHPEERGGGREGGRPHLLGGGSGMRGMNLPLSLLPVDFPWPPSPGVSPARIYRPGWPHPCSPAGVPRVHSVYVTMTWPTGGSRSERPRAPSARRAWCVPLASM